MMKSRKILAGFVNWNEKEDSLTCIDNIYKAAKEEFQLNAVVVDNASTDNSVAEMNLKFPKVHVIKNKRNTGAAGGRNVLFEYFLETDADYFMLLDPDVRINHDIFEILLKEIERDVRIGCIGVKAYYADNPDVFWCKGGGVYNPWLGRFEKLGQKERDVGQYEHSEEVESIPAGFTFIRREVIRQVPRMDEDYFIYYEESDWNVKVRKKGWRLVTSERAKTYHQVSTSLGMESPNFYYYRTRNALLYAVRHSPVYCWPVFFLYFFFINVPDTCLTLYLSQKGPQIKALLFGIFDFFRAKWGKSAHAF